MQDKVIVSDQLNTELKSVNEVKRETELAFRDSNNPSIVLSMVRVGDLCPINRVWCRVIEVGDNKIVLRPESYTSRALKRAVNQHREEKKIEGKRKNS